MPQQIITFINQSTGKPIGRLEMEQGQDLSWDDANALAALLSQRLGTEIAIDISPI